MKHFKININSNLKIKNLNIAIGNFDGVHIGHKKIIKKLVSDSKKLNLKSAILSFHPHPRQYFTNNFNDFNIVEESKKIELLKDLKIDYYFSLRFDSKLSSFQAEEFVNKILSKKLNVKKLTVGYDFKFGKNRQGNTELLKQLSKKYNFKINIIKQIILPNSSKAYSSSLVRKYIKQGNFKKVSKILGRKWTITGKVIKGHQRASTINFPTANIDPGTIITPKKGVYAINAILNKKNYEGIANFGERPTVKGNKLLLEAHIFDFNQNIYGKKLTVQFLTFIRDEKKFKNFELLTKQIRKDIRIVQEYHSTK